MNKVLIVTCGSRGIGAATALLAAARGYSVCINYHKNQAAAASRLGSAGEYVDYAASKGAVDTLTIGLSREVAEEGIRVNAVRPAFIYTDMHADGGEPGRVDRIKESLPMQRGGQPAEVANVTIWPLSEDSVIYDRYLY